MKIRTQLLLINLASISLLIAALLVSYWRMLLTLQQTWWLTAVALGAGAASSLAFGWMTSPITRSMQRLVHFANQVSNLSFRTDLADSAGPTELRQLAVSLKAMGQKLATTFDQLERMERTRRELVANVSHDLRTPLASIQSYVEALQDGVVAHPNEMDTYLQTIHTETRRLSALIDDLFELSKLEAGQTSLDASQEHLDQVLIEAIDSHRLQLMEKGIRLSVDLPSHLPPLYLSKEKIHRVLSNLLQNAIRHAPVDSGIQIRVSVLSTQEVEVSIQDEGPGVKSDEADRLFERFYRADPSRTRNSGGAGLGLAIAKWLMQLHRGRIGVRERWDGKSGADFWFTLLLHSVFEPRSQARGEVQTPEG